MSILRIAAAVFLILGGVCVSAAPDPVSQHASAAQQTFLEDLAHRSFRFFWEQANATNGLVADRAPADGQGATEAASIASVGFGLTGICIADSRGWIDSEAARQRVLTTLRYFWNEASHEKGFFFHFLDMRNGKRLWKCELSSIDTALLMAGILTARQHFDDPEIHDLASQLYERVDWCWMLNGGRTMSMGWTPENGFLDARWDGYSEHMLLYLLGLGSTSHPLPAESWTAWRRTPVGTYAGNTFLQCPPLFTHQYSHAWVDFRDMRDAFADYWLNSRLATRAQRVMCIQMSDRFPQYGPLVWGLTSSDGPDGYKGWGGPPPTVNPPIDGSVVPCAAGGSIAFEPVICSATLMHMQKLYGNKIWQRYGFVDAFNPHTGWVSKHVIGIDTGITLVMSENVRSGMIWETFMKNPEIQTAMYKAGFVSTSKTVADGDRSYLETLARDTWQCLSGLAHADTGLPYDTSDRGDDTSVSNIGLYLSDIAAAERMGFIRHGTAVKRIRRTLESVKKLETDFGFQQSWNSVSKLKPGRNDTWISILDSGNLAAGLLTVGQAYPDFQDDCRQLVDAMQWKAFYSPERRSFCGGYNRATREFNQEWTVCLLGADSRMASFLAVASQQVPLDHWSSLNREWEERHGARYLKPGWQGGGLFMQYISGIWLDEKGTIMGQSAANFAYAQIIHARRNDYPVWGWSASDSPEGKYLGWGKLQDNVVTPHASALAIGDYPQEVTANLRAFEALGARDKRLGFLDAVDFRSGRKSQRFLFLDQSMLFLSLVNYLRDNAVKKWFEADPMIQRGRHLIKDYRQTEYGARRSLLNP